MEYALCFGAVAIIVAAILWAFHKVEKDNK